MVLYNYELVNILLIKILFSECVAQVSSLVIALV